MEKIEHYFTIDLCGDNWSEITEKSKYIFYDPYYEISTDNNYELPFIILHFITNYNLSDLELILRLAGFSALLPEEMPYRHVDTLSYSTSPRYISDSWFDGCLTKKHAEKYIEEKLGTGIIAKYRESKNEQYARERLKIAELAKKYGLGVYDLERGRNPYCECGKSKGR